MQSDRAASCSIHPAADVSSKAKTRTGTRIWHDAQVSKGVRMGAHCIVSKRAYIDFGAQIGDAVKMQNRASVYHGMTIKDGVFIGPHVVVTNAMCPRAINPDGTHETDDDWEIGETTIRYGASRAPGVIS